MKLIFLATFLLIISGAQAISNEDEDFNMNFTKENRSIIQSNEQAHSLGNLYRNGNIEVSTRLVESNNEHKHELSVTIRKGGGIGRAGGGSRGRLSGGRAGGAAATGAAGAGAGVAGSESANHENRHSKSSATSLMEVPWFCFSTFILCVSILL